LCRKVQERFQSFCKGGCGHIDKLANKLKAQVNSRVHLFLSREFGQALQQEQQQQKQESRVRAFHECSSKAEPFSSCSSGFCLASVQLKRLSTHQLLFTSI
jgi:3-polyprenyl-4-hydroxybenzoate decarboxylase